jgi:hypothetical protein
MKNDDPARPTFLSRHAQSLAARARGLDALYSFTKSENVRRHRDRAAESAYKAACAALDARMARRSA